MEKLKKRYLLLDSINNCIAILFVILWLPVVVADIFNSFLIEGVLVLVQAGLLIISGLLGIFSRKTLKSFFLKGCKTGENMLDYNVRLNYPSEIKGGLPKVTFIRFNKYATCYTIEVYYYMSSRKKVIYIYYKEIEKISNYIIFDK